MFMPQHPVYTKLVINKYCIKNQHPGLNALINLLCILDVLCACVRARACERVHVCKYMPLQLYYWTVLGS